MDSRMKGAENEAIRSNPAVKSKGDLHGHGRTPPHLSHPGATVPVTGTKVAGHTENGHMLPKDATPAFGGHKVTHYSPGEMGAPILDGKGQHEAKNTAMTDSIRK